jgi:hypothetical protein
MNDENSQSPTNKQNFANPVNPPVDTNSTPTNNQPVSNMTNPPADENSGPVKSTNPPVNSTTNQNSDDTATTTSSSSTISTSSDSKSTSPLQSDDELSEDQFVTGGDDHSFITSVSIPKHPNTKFDEKEFLELLAKSISLTKKEKQRIIASIPKLSQYQIDELIRIFKEEQTKFAALNTKHVDELKKLEKKHKKDWNDVEMQAKQENKQKQDVASAEEIRKNLGI